MTARAWLVVALVGLALFVVGTRTDPFLALAGVIALIVGVVGVLWRVLAGR